MQQEVAANVRNGYETLGGRYETDFPLFVNLRLVTAFWTNLRKLVKRAI